MIITAGRNQQFLADLIFYILNPFFSVRKIPRNFFPLATDKNDVLIFEADLDTSADFSRLEFLIKNAGNVFLVASQTGETSGEKEIFPGDSGESDKIKKLVMQMPEKGYLVLNYDDESARRIKNGANVNLLTFGFSEKADLKASDVNVSEEETNFKINYQGDIVPVWLRNIFGKDKIYGALAAVCLAVLKGLNLVEASQSLRIYKGK